MRAQKYIIIVTAILAVMIALDVATTVLCLTAASKVYGYATAVNFEVNPVGRLLLEKGILVFVIFNIAMVVGYVMIAYTFGKYINKRSHLAIVILTYTIAIMIRITAIINNINVYKQLTS